MLQHTRILVADDDVELLGFVAEALEAVGAEVTRAKNGAELIERLNDKTPFALVVTDVSMPWMSNLRVVPWMSGLEVMESARFVGVTTPVIIMTALRDGQLPLQVAAMGRQVALLRKPFDANDLRLLADSLLASPEPSIPQPPRL